jgi:hypothetical protein
MVASGASGKKRPSSSEASDSEAPTAQAMITKATHSGVDGW